MIHSYYFLEYVHDDVKLHLQTFLLCLFAQTNCTFNLNRYHFYRFKTFSVCNDTKLQQLTRSPSHEKYRFLKKYSASFRMIYRHNHIAPRNAGKSLVSMPDRYCRAPGMVENYPRQNKNYNMSTTFMLIQHQPYIRYAHTQRILIDTANLIPQNNLLYSTSRSHTSGSQI